MVNVMTTNRPLIATRDEDIARCFDVMAELRPHLNKASFVSLIRGMERDGYCLVYIEEDGAVVAVAGYRMHTTLFMGKNLYVDDLVTGEACRSRGHGKELIDWLRNLAIESECTHIHLDSGTQRNRAHRFYLRQGMDISSFHFSQKLDSI